jgi:hypothetical protein
MYSYAGFALAVARQFGYWQHLQAKSRVIFSDNDLGGTFNI